MTARAVGIAFKMLEEGGASNKQMEKFEKLVGILETCAPAVVAFSGGVDSSFLAYTTFQVQGSRMLAVTVESGLDVPEQAQSAADFARKAGFPQRQIKIDVMQAPEIVSNPPERCYFCKRNILEQLWKIARREGFAAVLEGQNIDDQGDYRPGRRAVQETGTRSPLAESGLNKMEIRLLSQLLGLTTWNRPSAPCLATRFPYNRPITTSELEKIAAGEKFLTGLGFEDCRVRLYGDMVRLEVKPEQIEQLAAQRKQVAAFFKAAGFSHVALDLEGYRQGSMNAGLQL